MATTDTQSRTTIAAYFSTHDTAENAVNELKLSGFKASQIGYAGRLPGSGLSSGSIGAGYGGAGGGGNTVIETSVAELDGAGGLAGNSGSTLDAVGTHQPGTATGTRFAAGSAETAGGHATGGTWQKIKNFFDGGDVESHVDENARNDSASDRLNPASTPDTSGVAGGDMNAGASSEGFDPADMHGSFSDLSVPEEHSRYFGHRIGQGEEGAVVTVNAVERVAEAEEILRRNGGDLGTEAGNYDYDGSDGALEGAGTQRIQLLGEVLRVHKDRVNRGEIRIRKEVVTEQQTVQVPVTHEELVLERVPVHGTTPVAGVIGQESVIRIPLTDERASVDKETVVREEVHVGKRSVEDVENLSSNVGHEELRVENDTSGGNV